MTTESEIMYKPVETLFRKLGFRVIVDSLGVQPFRSGGRRIFDILAYRWQGDGIDAVAVECKKAKPPDGILEAIDQTISSMLFLSKCYIATPAGSDLSVLPILEKLGVGYIGVDNRRAFVVREPNPLRMALKDEARYIKQLRPKLNALLAFEDFAGDDIRLKEMRGDWWWLALDVVPEVKIQQNIWASPGNRCVFSGINFEKKEPVVRAARNILSGQLEDFTKAIRRLPRGYRIRVREVTRLKGGRHKELLTQKTGNYSTEKAKKILRAIVSVESHKWWWPELSIHRRIWALTEDEPCDEGKKRLAEVSDEISPIVDILKSVT